MFPECCRHLFRSPELSGVINLERDFLCCAEDYPVALVPIGLLRPHEEVDPSRLRSLEEEILGAGYLERPVLVECETLIILDGHHRVAVLRKLGKTVVPALLVSYEDPCVSVDSWRSDWVVTKDLVIRAGFTGKLLPHKTSRHRLCFEVPEVRYPLSMLR